MFKNKIKAGIVGGAGYTGGELIRLLINHPAVEIAFVHSESNAGNLLSDVHSDLFGETELRFAGNLTGDIDVLFLCVGHAAARKFLEANAIGANVKIIDLSQDFRLRSQSAFDGRNFTYGLPEINRTEIQNSSNIANPGCFATCIELGLLPLAANGLLTAPIHINGTTGSTGAGQSLSPTSHFSWRNNNLSVYKAFEHQHLLEIGETLKQLQSNLTSDIHFVPQRGNFPRGILTAMYTECLLPLDEITAIYKDYYSTHRFTHISTQNIDLKQVVNTNKCLVHLEKHGNNLFIVSILDNLLKGASGQAVQNMNLMFSLDEDAGLRLKGIGF